MSWRAELFSSALAIAATLFTGSTTFFQTQDDSKSSEPVVNNAPKQAPLEVVAEFPNRQVTGVTVSEDGRVFVNFPLWDPDAYEGAVAEVQPDGSLTPYPNEQWNAWRMDSDLDPRESFVCVQSVVADGHGSLWALDPAAPKMDGTVRNGPKVVRIDLSTNEVSRVYPFSAEVAPQDSYLNDIRIDNERGYAYITESGAGAIIVLNTESGEAWRLLDDHPSTESGNVKPWIGDRPLLGANGQPPKIHADGIALDANGEHLYYHALTGYDTYRIPTKALRELTDQPDSLAAEVESLGSDVLTDGMILDSEGNLYYSALEYDGILKRMPDGNIRPVLIDERLRWPDTFAIGPNGYLYVTTSQIHLMPRFNNGESRVEHPYGVYRIKLDVKPAQP